MAIYGERVALLPQLLDILFYHPQGMRFSDLAGEVDRSEADVRETLRVYWLTDLAHYLPDLVARPDVLEFLADDPEDDGDPATATLVRLVVKQPGRELGVSYTSMTDLARLYRIATDAQVLDPENAVLASAIRKLGEGVLPGLRIIEPVPWAHLAELRMAVREHRRIKITYARVWTPVIDELAVEPYGLVRTRRGWELDASPGDELSSLRTYLLTNIRDIEVLDERFTPPDGLPELISDHRTPQAVIMDVPPFARWAVDKYAERVELLEDGVDLVRLRVSVLQPYRLRVGLMLVAGGATARVVEPVELRNAGADVATVMLRRYEEPVAGASDRSNRR